MRKEKEKKIVKKKVGNQYGNKKVKINESKKNMLGRDILFP